MKNVQVFLKNRTDKQEAYRKMRILILNGSPRPKGNGVCVQKDDMQEVYSLLAEAKGGF